MLSWEARLGSVSLQETKELVSIGKDVVIALAAAWAGIIGFLGLQAWRRELKGKSEFKWIQPRNADGEKMDMSGKLITYAAYWDDDGIRVLVNNRLVLHFKKHIPSNPFPLILNLAVEGGRGREPDSKTVFPADFIIDYVRVYRRK